MAKRQSFTVSEVIDELFMDYDSEHQSDEADDDSDPVFQANSDANNETGLCTIYSRVFTQNFIMIHSQLSILQRLFWPNPTQHNTSAAENHLGRGSHTEITAWAE